MPIDSVDHVRPVIVHRIESRLALSKGLVRRYHRAVIEDLNVERINSEVAQCAVSLRGTVGILPNGTKHSLRPGVEYLGPQLGTSRGDISNKKAWQRKY